jgi:hypothetical protein
MTKPEQSNPNELRAPTPREHRLAAWLFGGFAVFFVACALFLSGSWFQWLFLVLGLFALVRATWHAVISRRGGGEI